MIKAMEAQKNDDFVSLKIVRTSCWIVRRWNLKLILNNIVKKNLLQKPPPHRNTKKFILHFLHTTKKRSLNQALICTNPDCNIKTQPHSTHQSSLKTNMHHPLETSIAIKHSDDMNLYSIFTFIFLSFSSTLLFSYVYLFILICF